jgi:hypothetical protein
VRLAVSQGISSLPPETEKPESLRHWVVKEARELLSQLRRSVNGLNAEPIPPQSSDGAGTYLAIWTSGEAPQDGGWTLTAEIQGDSATVYASYEVSQSFRSLAGTISAVSALAFDRLQESAAGCDARYTIDSTNRVITLDVRDDAAVAMSWSGTAYSPTDLVRE